MAAKQYGYYIKGNKLAVVEKDIAFDNDPNSRDYGPGLEHAQWKSPLSNVSDGIELELSYVQDMEIIDSEDYELDLPIFLQKALIDYLKAKDAEDGLDIEKYEYFMMRFKKKVEQFNNSRIAGVRIVAAGPYAVR